MTTQLFLIWHQFIKETREHRTWLLGILISTAAYTGFAASGRLENIQGAWSQPFLMDYPLLPLLFTLVPGLFLVPFLAFADSCREADAFWVTKPLGTTTVVGAKFLWISLWLIAVPLLGESIVVLSLGGKSNLGPIMFDFVLVRAAYFFTAFALASLFNRLLHFTLAAVCIPFVGITFTAIVETFSPEISGVSRNSPTGISALLVWCLWLPGISILIASLQYHYRFGMKTGALCALSAFAAGSILASRPIDLLRHPVPTHHRQELGTDGITVRLDASAAAPSTLNPQGDSRDKLELEISISETPPLSVLLFNRVHLTIRAADQSFVIEENAHKINTYTEPTNPIDRVFGEIIATLKKEAKTSQTVRGKITVPLPAGMKIDQWEGENVSITGQLDFDLFDHSEFGRLEPKLNGDYTSSLESDGTIMNMHWPRDPSRHRYVEFQFRHLASNSSAHNHELRSQWNPLVKSWHFIFRNRQQDIYRNQMDSHVTTYCLGSSFCSLHVGRCIADFPTGLNIDEVIVYGSRYLGTIQREFQRGEITLTRKD